jgi:hypothetical protein
MWNRGLSRFPNGSTIWKASLRLILLSAALMVISCAANRGASQPDQSFTIKRNGSFTEREIEQRGLKGKVIMIKSKYCKQCSATLPHFETACEELGIVPIVLDVAESADQKALDRIKVQAQYVPTFIFGGSFYVGPRSIEELRTMLDYFLRG